MEAKVDYPQGSPLFPPLLDDNAALTRWSRLSELPNRIDHGPVVVTTSRIAQPPAGLIALFVVGDFRRLPRNGLILHRLSLNA